MHPAVSAIISEEQDILACLKQEGEIQIALISPVGFGFNRLLRRHGGKTIGKLVIIARTVTPRKDPVPGITHSLDVSFPDGENVTV